MSIANSGSRTMVSVESSPTVIGDGGRTFVWRVSLNKESKSQDKLCITRGRTHRTTFLKCWRAPVGTAGGGVIDRERLRERFLFDASRLPLGVLAATEEPSIWTSSSDESPENNLRECQKRSYRSLEKEKCLPHKVFRPCPTRKLILRFPVAFPGLRGRCFKLNIRAPTVRTTRLSRLSIYKSNTDNSICALEVSRRLTLLR